MPKMLMLRLEGPLQSWGSSSRFDVRGSDAFPTKSGVIGLIACAFGYVRGDVRVMALDKALRMGVRADRPGIMLADYHTVTGERGCLFSALGGKRVGGATIVTPRQYLQDSCFTVVLEGEEALVEACAQALQNPVWQTYLGRKSCVPTRPVFEKIVEYDTLRAALGDYPHAARHRPPMLCEIEDRDGLTVRYDALRESGMRYDMRRVRLEQAKKEG